MFDHDRYVGPGSSSTSQFKTRIQLQFAKDGKLPRPQNQEICGHGQKLEFAKNLAETIRKEIPTETIKLLNSMQQM